jgi:hypothetical protein
MGRVGTACGSWRVDSRGRKSGAGEEERQVREEEDEGGERLGERAKGRKGERAKVDLKRRRPSSVLSVQTATRWRRWRISVVDIERLVDRPQRMYQRRVDDGSVLDALRLDVHPPNPARDLLPLLDPLRPCFLSFVRGEDVRVDFALDDDTGEPFVTEEVSGGGAFVGVQIQHRGKERLELLGFCLGDQVLVLKHRVHRPELELGDMFELACGREGGQHTTRRTD